MSCEVHQRLKEVLGNNRCYVLITCGEPTSDGKVEVEMSYEGDTYLAAYLVENAQHVLDEHIGYIEEA